MSCDQVDTKQRILREASVLFAANGYDGVSVRAICAASEVSLPMIAYYFQNKAGLYKAILEDLTESFNRELEAVNMEAIPAHLRLRKYLEAAVKAHLKTPYFSGVFGHEAHPSGVLLEVMKSSNNRYFGDYIAVLIEEAQKSGGLRDDIEPRYAARIIAALFNSHPTITNLYKVFYKTEPEMSKILEAVVEFCLGALEKKS